MDGFLLDVTYTPPARRGQPGEAVAWFKDDGGRVHRLAEPFVPIVYARAKPARLTELERLMPLFDGPASTFRTHAKCGLSEEAEEVLGIPVPDARKIPKLVQAIDARGGFRDHELYDADLRLSHRYFVAKGIFPFARMRAWTAGRYRLMDDQWATDYTPPPLAVVELDVRPDCPRGQVPSASTPIASARLVRQDADGAPIEERVVEGMGERATLDALQAHVRDMDPDVLLTRGGDSFLLPYLYARASERGTQLVLGREAMDAEKAKLAGKSFFTYGKIKYRAPTYALSGRIHLDARSSFFYHESGLAGLVDLSRVARVPLQEMARAGAGTAVTAIQIDLAKREGRLIPWKKNAPEAFKTARLLLQSDRGGYIYEPQVGLHDDVVELDFASLYPNIMVHRNISPEVILCDCCSWESAPETRRVPQLGTWTCAKRLGFIPRAIGPIVMRREHFKKLRKREPDNFRVHSERVDVYKWLLVTSFGYQGYKNAKFGRIECHEAIGAWGREILLTASEVAREFGFETVHGIVDSLWLARGKDAEASAVRERIPTAALGQDISKAVSDEVGIRFEYEGRYKWIVFLPNRSQQASDDAPAVGALNRYYGCFDKKPDKPNRSQPGQPLDHLAGGTLKVRGIEYRQHSTPRVMMDAQRLFLETVARAENAEEFRALLDEAIDAVRPLLHRLRAGDVPLSDLVWTNMVGRRLEEYRSDTLARSAVKQLSDAGVQIEPGQSVRYVVRDHTSRVPTERVVEARLMKGHETYDAPWYESQVIRAVASLVLPFGWDEARLSERYAPGARQMLLAP